MDRTANDLHVVLTALRNGALPPQHVYSFAPARVSALHADQDSWDFMSTPTTPTQTNFHEQRAATADNFSGTLYRQRIIELAWQFCRRDNSPAGGELPDLLRAIDASAYLSRERSTSVPLKADKVSLPDGSVPPVEVLLLLPEDMREKYSRLHGVFDPTRLANSRRRRDPNVPKGSELEYLKLLRRMYKARMVMLQVHRPLIVNGFFVVPKPDGALRLIIDCRPTNDACEDPPHTCLPNPCYFGRLPPEFTWMSKSDLSDFYHTILLPRELIPLFGLPPVRVSELLAVGFTRQELELPDSVDLVYPCCTTLPMGWSHSVYIAQTVHETALEQYGAVPGCRVVSLTRLDPSKPLSQLDVIRGIYIDDVLNWGCSASTSNAALEASGVAYNVVGFRLKATKRCAAAQQQTGLGVDFDGVRRQFRVAPTKIQTIIAETVTVVFTCGKVDVATVRSLVGRWLWACMVRRPSLSLLSKTFAFINRFQSGKAKLWMSCKRELAALCALAPALVGSTAAHDSTVFATDASTPGYGVTYCRSEDVEHLLHYVETRGYHVRLDPVINDALAAAAVAVAPRDPPALRVWVLGQRWLVAVKGRFRVRSHINRQEIIATILALRWMGQQKRFWGARVFLLCDSTVAVGALAKGRSSARALTALCRRFAGLTLTFGIEVSLIWVSTDINPADGPSRGCGVALPEL